ncbi:MAG: chloride channel protein [Melioribacteraceae bacterium]|nr:chloride channel protein [Melioribacteraceae bacterium]MCF8352903.1 chloride channel protein [Melioribacteraceae bacterium]MCF8393780.1 chloride channel protein [Melioribacteraceae bacterium]MCF8417420.1 chloride channel protein [Melioribacteraceae bacterium]
MIKLAKKYFENNFGNKFQQLFRKVTFPEYAVFSFFAIITGAVAGISAVIFHNSIEFFNSLFFEQTIDGLFFLGTAAVIVLPALGMLIQSIMIKIKPKIASKRGVSEVIKSVALRGGYIPFRETIFHFIAPVISIGSGNTVGPEGPAAQIGGGVASKLGNLLGLSDNRRRMFTAAGAGAAIAAIFNTPLGGIFFALEIILLNDFQTPTFSALILASVTASAISRIFLGNVSIFQFTSPEIGSYQYFYLYIILGLGAGLLSILFIRYSSSVERFFKKKVLTRVPQMVLMVSIGLVMGTAGFFYKDIFGIGYDGINHLLASKTLWDVALILLIIKFLLVPLILNSGGFGGLFAPSLFMGACFGFLFSHGINYFFGLNTDPTTYILVSMGAVLGGINSIPISAILIIFEMTQDYTFILPLMLAVVLSTTLVQIVLKGSIHVKHLEREGYNISQGRESNILRQLTVEDVMKKEIQIVPYDLSLTKLISMLMESPFSTFYTTNDSGDINGIITQNELRPIISEYEQVRDMLVAGDIASNQVISVETSDDLEKVMKIFGKEDLDELLVRSSEISGEILGIISKQDVIKAYNKESFKYNLADNFVHEIKTINRKKASKIAEGYSIVERMVPDEFVGKTLSELKLRNKYGLEVLMIKKQINSLMNENDETNLIVPDPKYIIAKDDWLVIFGTDENIETMNEL